MIVRKDVLRTPTRAHSELQLYIYRTMYMHYVQGTSTSYLVLVHCSS